MLLGPIRRRRLERGLSQEGLAALTNGRVSAPRISQIENGLRPRDPSVYVLLARALGCQVADLIDESHRAAGAA